MSGYTPSSANGGLAGGEGQTTQVGLSGRLSPKDQKVLCDAMCKCNRIGVATVDGKMRKQSCVAQRLNAANTVSTAMTGMPTKYRPEVSYDMRPTPPLPPVPIMRSTSPLESHSFIPAWIQKYWPGGNEAYKKVKGQGDIRRPDVVIVNDPSQPPEQSNIQTVVEMKFPPDDMNRGQRAAYIRIAGSSKKFVTMTPADCGCGGEDPDEKPAMSTQSQSAKDIFGTNLSGGPGSALPPALPPLPPIPAALP